jgi:hypothetical protein
MHKIQFFWIACMMPLSSLVVCTEMGTILDAIIKALLLLIIFFLFSIPFVIRTRTSIRKLDPPEVIAGLGRSILWRFAHFGTSSEVLTGCGAFLS